MQPSIIQLLDTRYLGIKMCPQPADKIGDQDVESFDFNGVSIGERISITPLADNGEQLPENSESLFYLVTLRISIENKEGKIAPYDIDINLAGRFKISHTVQKEKQKDMVLVNGCSILYSTIRELVVTLSARSVYGILTLPTVNFQDHIQKNTGPPQDSQPTKKKKTVKK